MEGHTALQRLAGLRANGKNAKLCSRLGGVPKYPRVPAAWACSLLAAGISSRIDSNKRFSRCRGNRGDCPLPNGLPSVSRTCRTVPPGHLLPSCCRSSWLRQVPGPGSRPGGGIKTSYFGPGAWPPGVQPGLSPTVPGRCSPGRPRYSAHPSLSQRHRIRPSLPGTGLMENVCPVSF